MPGALITGNKNNDTKSTESMNKKEIARAPRLEIMMTPRTTKTGNDGDAKRTETANKKDCKSTKT